MTKLTKIVLAAVLGVAFLATGGVWLYLNVFTDDAPAELGLSSTTATPTASSTAPTSTGPVAAEGTWTATNESVLGYRVKEILFGQSAEAAGRTSVVTGTLTIEGTKATAAQFSVDMTTVKSDRSQRDSQFRGRIMDTSQFPTSTFTLTSPIDFKQVPTDGQTITARATGDLTLHGVTKSVTFEVQARKTGSKLEVDGEIPVVFADYNIDNPSGGPAQTEDDGILEFLLVFAKS